MAGIPKMIGFSYKEARAVFDTLNRHYIIIAPVKNHGMGRFSDTGLLTYDEVNSFDEIEFFEKTYFSAKHALLPIRQTLFAFQNNRIEEADGEIRAAIIFLRSCDIHAIQVTDAHFLKDGFEDLYYKRMRQRVKIFLIECEKSFENCSCVSFGTNKTDNYSAFIRKIDSGYEVQIKDKEIESYFPNNVETVEGPHFVEQNARSVSMPEDVDSSIFEDDIWKEYTLRCIACGRCTIACPTCTCFSVQDILKPKGSGLASDSQSHCEDGATGERKRIWSSCQVKKFSLLAGNHDFRIKEGDRLRYRVLHKIYDFRKRHGINMCIGCGRCDDVCPEYISMFKCIEKINHIIEARAANG